MRALTRIGIIAGVSAFALAAAVVTVFALGKPMAPQAAPQTAASAGVGAAPTASAPTSTPASITASPAEGVVPAEEPSGALAIEIPGCVCHSDDPQVVAEHATYRMSECFECHQDGMPEMGR